MKKLIKLLLVFILMISEFTLIQAQEEQEEFKNTYQYEELDIDLPKFESATDVKMALDALPSAYDSRNLGYVTEVKNQGELGLCWAYSMMAAAETSVLKNQLAPIEDLDFSEHHLAYFYFHRGDDPLNLANKDNNAIVNEEEKTYLVRGGNAVLASMFMSQWGGVIDDDLAPLSMSLSEQKAGLDESLAYGNELFYMKDALFVPSLNITTTQEEKEQTVLLMKQLLIEYGALSTSYNSLVNPATNNTYETENPYLYVKDNIGANHAVTIVGYNDYISKEAFYPHQPSRDGGWIVKNSWGDFKNSDDGYFYISYDYNLDVTVAFDYMDISIYDNNYFYDGTSTLSNYNSSSKDDKAVVANVFTSQKEKEYLKAVSIGIKSSNTDYEIQIYKNLKDLNDPTSGEAMLKTPTKGSKQISGIYTIPLNEAVELNKGDTFSVVVTLTNREKAYAEYYITAPFNDGFIDYQEDLGKQQSFFLFNDHWYDMSEGGMNACARIKALTANELKDGIDIANANVSLEYDEVVYDGTRKQPSVKITMDDQELVKGKDYFVEYQDNYQAGNAKVIITGISQYDGMIEKTFAINENEQKVTITTQLSEENGGFVHGSGTYGMYENVRLEAFTNAGYSFDGWLIDGNYVSNSNVYIFKATKDCIVTPCFKAEDTSGLLKVFGKVNDIQAGAIKGAGLFKEGDVVTLEAKVNPGFVFDGWYIDGNKVASSYTHTLLVNTNIEIEARFAKEQPKKIKVALNYNDELIVKGAGEYEVGKEVILEYLEHNAYDFIGWSINGEVVSKEKVFRFIASEDVEIEVLAQLKPEQICTITSSVNNIKYGSVDVVEQVRYGTKIEFKATPKPYCEFVGWEINGEFFNTSSNTYYYVNGDIDIKAIFKYESPFSDINVNEWYGKSVENAVLDGLMGSLKDDKFGPDVNISRGMVATVLYRMANMPKVEFKPTFSDVTKGSLWYATAITWASENKVVSGYKDGRFGPDDNITRQDLAIMLRNYAKAKGIDVTKQAELTSYVDVKKVDSYASSAIAWCVENKIISGANKADGTYLNPKDFATRAQCAKMFTLLNDLVKN